MCGAHSHSRCSRSVSNVPSLQPLFWPIRPNLFFFSSDPTASHLPPDPGHTISTLCRPPVSWGSDCFFAAVVTARSPRARAQHLTRKSYYLIIYWPGLWNAPGWNPVIITGSRLLINILFFPRIQSIPLSRANFYVSCCWAHLVGALCSQARDRGLALVLRPVATHCTRGSSRPWPKCQLCPVMTITWESWRDRSRTALSPLGKEVYLPTGAPSAPFLLLPAFLICL